MGKFIKLNSFYLEETQRLAQMGSWHYDVATDDLSVNVSFYDIYEASDLEFITLDDLYGRYTPHYKKILEENFRRLLDEGRPYDIEAVATTFKGNKRWVRIIGKPVFVDGKVTELLGVLQDITEKKKREDEAVLAYERIQLALKSLKMGLWDWDTTKNELYWDDTIYEIMGVDKNTPISFEFFDTLIFPEDKPAVLKAINNSIESGKHYEINYRIKTPAGEIRHIAARGKVIEREEGQLFTGMTWDITKDVELQEKLKIQESKIVASARLSSLGEMASAIAHEINNPLAIIQGKADSLKRRIATNKLDKDSTVEGLNKIEETCERIVKIIKGLKTFSRNSEKDPFNLVSLDDVLADALSLISQKLAYNSIDLQISKDDGIFVQGRASQLGQVIMNLLNNAFDAVENLPEKWIKVEIKKVKNKAIIRMIDSGRGISSAVRLKIFDPFYTSKEIGKGTGLGLSISKGIIEEHHGSISIDSEHPNTCFVIELPAQKAPEN